MTPIRLLFLGGVICAAFLATDAYAARDIPPAGKIPGSCAQWFADGAGAGPTIVENNVLSARVWRCTDVPGDGIRLESTP